MGMSARDREPSMSLLTLRAGTLVLLVALVGLILNLLVG
jgi:hypothetical protein